MQGGAGKRAKKPPFSGFYWHQIGTGLVGKTVSSAANLVPGSPKTKDVFRLRSYNDNA